MQFKSKTLRCLFYWPQRVLGCDPWEKISEKICVTELNEHFLNIIPNSWNKQAYVQVFDCESITFKASVNIFERMEIP